MRNQLLVMPRFRLIGEARGFAIVGFFVLLLISSLVVVGMLTLTTDSLRGVSNTKIRTERYYQTSDTTEQALGWLRANSEKTLSPFLRSNFYTLFDKSTPGAGTNDSTLSIPTHVKLKGTAHSAILVSDAALGTAAFPLTLDPATSLPFDATGNFQSSNFGNAKVRLTLVDAVPEDASGDYGPPPAPTPTTDFVPIYRIDAFSEANAGTHLYAYAVGELEGEEQVGFYGENLLDLRRDCDSYDSTRGAYSASSNRSANCVVGSESNLQLQSTATIYGAALSNGTVVNAGQVCSDFDSGCPNAGEICQGSGCNISPMPSYGSWDVDYCPPSREQPPLVIAVDTVLVVSGNRPEDMCWSSVTINKNRSLTLVSTGYPYFFRQLTFLANADLIIAPASSGTVQLYLRQVSANRIVAGDINNTTADPSRFRIDYLGSAALELSFNGDMYFSLYAPAAAVTLTGTGHRDFFGAIAALSLRDATSSGHNISLHYDSALSSATAADISFRLRGIGQGLL